MFLGAAPICISCLENIFKAGERPGTEREEGENAEKKKECWEKTPKLAAATQKSSLSLAQTNEGTTGGGFPHFLPACCQEQNAPLISSALWPEAVRLLPAAASKGFFCGNSLELWRLKYIVVYLLRLAKQEAGKRERCIKRPFVVPIWQQWCYAALPLTALLHNSAALACCTLCQRYVCLLLDIASSEDHSSIGMCQNNMCLCLYTVVLPSQFCEITWCHPCAVNSFWYFTLYFTSSNKQSFHQAAKVSC